MLASLFGASGVKTGGALFTEYEARGPLHGVPVRVVFEMSRARTGTAPFTTIEVEVDLDLCVYSGGAEWPYPSWEPFSLFQSQRLSGVAMVGAPRGVLLAITHGPISERLTATGISRLTLGSEATRAGCSTQGVQLVIEGWPLDEAALRFIAEAAVEIALTARRELLRGGEQEVSTYRAARARSRGVGLRVLASVLVGLGALGSLVGLTMWWWSR